MQDELLKEDVQNGLAYSLCVLAASVVAAFLLHRVFGWIKKLLLKK